jgi:NADPH-dependent 2,4-dienoyl-CoA reductase/sulfur reductase-like enzyme
MRAMGEQYGSDSHVLIVGGGPAGYAAAAELRSLGYSGGVSVACAEAYAPYDRPSCSKGLLSGHQLPGDIMLDQGDLHAGVDWRLGRRATWLDPERHVVGFDTGETCRYDGLIVATGTHSVAPDGVPVGAPGLHMLHTIDDAWRIRQDLRHAGRVAVVGGGLTGCEVACGVRAQARDAVLIHSGPQLMSKVLGEYVGGLVTESHEAAGIDLRLRTRVVTMDRETGRWRLWLDNGTAVHADMVIMTVGERPSVSWLADTGIDCSDGVLCDEALRVVGARDIVAAGALARWPDVRRSETPQRVGHWIAALEHGRGAARTLLAGGDAEPVTVTPRFWSEQNGLRIQVCGRIDPGADIAISELRPGRRDTARAGVLATYYLDGMAIGVVGINAPHAFTIAARALQANVVMTPSSLRPAQHGDGGRPRAGTRRPDPQPVRFGIAV